jgi:hypothetical protein
MTNNEHIRWQVCFFYSNKKLDKFLHSKHFESPTYIDSGNHFCFPWRVVALPIAMPRHTTSAMAVDPLYSPRRDATLCLRQEPSVRPLSHEEETSAAKWEAFRGTGNRGHNKNTRRTAQTALKI